MLYLWASGLAAQTPGSVPFADGFEDSQVKEGRSFLREAPRGWRISQGRLELRTNGNLWESTNTQPKLLLREPPIDSSTAYTVEVTVSNRSDLTERFEHGGLIWYLDDDNRVMLTQLNHVQHKTHKIMLVHEVEADGRASESFAEPYTPARVDLRLVVEDRVFSGCFRASEEEDWQKLGSLRFPVPRALPEPA